MFIQGNIWMKTISKENISAFRRIANANSWELLDMVLHGLRFVVVLV